MYEQAIGVHEKLVARNPEWKWALAYSYALAGRKEEARELAVEAERVPNPNNHVYQASISVALGDTDAAFRWLEAAYENRNPFFPFLKVPFFQPLRGDPRLNDLLRRLNLPTV
jgi:Flp pilus assembly protein TadD